MPRRLVLLNLAALTRSMIGADTPKLAAFAAQGSAAPLVPPLPALTCSSHATLITGALPRVHGVVANGWYERDHAKIFMWNRSANLVGGEPLWRAARAKKPDLRCANLFFRFCTHADCELIVTERPTYFANGRKGADVYTVPGELRERLYGRHGVFPFFNFWGPAAGVESTRWIISAAIDVLEHDAPDLLLAYAPTLDYDVQRFGPESPQAKRAVAEADVEAGRLIDAARARDMDVAIVSDYGFVQVHRPLFPNRELRRAGYVDVQHADNGELLEPGASRAFAVCDNQAAHVYVRDRADVSAVRTLLERMPGVARVLGETDKAEVGLDHVRSGELVALAEPDAWFAYPYWLDEARAPDFARCVDIFSKTGFDPCEMLLRPGLSGKLHAGLRFAQMRTGIRAPFDVIDPDPQHVGGARSIALGDLHNAPALLTSWPLESDGAVPMQDVKALVLRRMFE